MRTIKATEVRIGDRLRMRLGAELPVTRIDDWFMDRPGMLAFVEDSETQWLKMPARLDADVELVRRRSAPMWRPATGLAASRSGAAHFLNPGVVT